MQQTSCNEIFDCKKCGTGKVYAEHKNGLCFVSCSNCGAVSSGYPTEIQAIRSWNKKNKGGKYNV